MICGVLHRIEGSIPHLNEDKFYDWFSEKNNRISLRMKVLRGEAALLPLYDNLHLDTAKVSPEMYSKTFEWYVSELLIRELKFIAAGFRVFLEHAPDGGDYDVLGFSANELIYIETKSGRPNNISLSDLKAFANRAKFLTSAISVLYVDFEGVADHFNFRDLARATDASMIYQITDKQSGARLYRPVVSSSYLLENQAGGNPVRNLRFLFRTHYALEASLRSSREINPQLLDPEHFDVAWLS